MMSSSVFVQLPEYVQLSVLSFLPASSLGRVACVSRDMNAAARSAAARIVAWLQQVHFPSSNVHQLPLENKSLTTLEIAILRDMTHDRIMCVGGAYSEYSVAQLCMKTGTWSSGEDALTARDGSELVAFGGCLYSIGGEGDNAVRSVDRFDLFRNEWSKCGLLPRPSRQAAALAISDRLVIVGGEDTETSVVTGSVSTAKFSALNDVTATAFRTAGPSLNQPRKGHSAVVYNGQLWVAGGSVADGALSSSVETIDIDDLERPGARFEMAAPMTAARKNFKLVVIRDQLFAVGGDNMSTIEAYDEYTNSWMLETAFPSYRKNFSVCVYGTKICVLGGQDRRSKGLNSVDVYDITSMEWGVDCSAQSQSIVAGAGSGAGAARPRTGSFCKTDKKSQSEAVSIRKYDMPSSSRDSSIILRDFASGFVCGQSIALPFAQLTWAC